MHMTICINPSDIKKILTGALSGLRRFSASERPLKMMKNAFISPQKLFLLSRYLSWYLDYSVM